MVKTNTPKIPLVAVAPALQIQVPDNDEKCPECNEKVDNGGGCLTCKACGWALCHSV